MAKRILLIEDDKAMRVSIVEILESAGYPVVTAENGKKGVDQALKLIPDLIICDIKMPEFNGYEVLHILSQNRMTAHIPFIFLTAMGDKSKLRQGMMLGADDYLTKPFDTEDLLKVVEVRLKKSELLKKDYDRSVEGLHQFLDESRGFKELMDLSHERPVVHYKKKEMIYRENDAPYFLFFLNSGKVKIYKSHDEGKEYLIEILQKGAFFGYLPLLENSFYAESVSAFEDCEIFKIPKEDFLKLLYRNKEVAAKFIKMLSDQVVEMESQLLNLAYNSVKKRVAGSLLLLEKQFQVKQHGKTHILISREDLAQMAGTAVETVIRSLSEFKADKLVQIEGRDIIILNQQGLREIQ